MLSIHQICSDYTPCNICHKQIKKGETKFKSIDVPEASYKYAWFTLCDGCYDNFDEEKHIRKAKESLKSSKATKSYIEKLFPWEPMPPVIPSYVKEPCSGSIAKFILRTRMPWE